MSEQAPAEGSAFARVVVDVAPLHLDHPFDYRVPDGARVAPGQRVRVVFAGRRRTAWVLEVVDQPQVDLQKVRELSQIQGDVAWFDERDLRLYRWVAGRYGATLAAVLRHALPPRVAAVERTAAARGVPGVSETVEMQQARPAAPPAEPVRPADDELWREIDARALLAVLAERGKQRVPPAFWWPGPSAASGRAAHVADLVRRCLAAGASVLVLAPDPASDILDAALAEAGTAGADLRAARSDRVRYRDFLRCRSGAARVAVGERSAVFAPLTELGLVVVDDEANPAYKERRSPRHHARDVALAAARLRGAACLVCSELPSGAVWRLLRAGHVRALTADRASVRAASPRVEVIDTGGGPPSHRRTRITPPADRAVGAGVAAGRAVVVLAARGGVGAALACTRCGRRRACPVCDGSVRPVRPAPDDGRPAWECPACGWRGRPFACSVCGEQTTAPLAAGAGRLAQELARSHPQAEVVAMEGFDAEGPSRRPAVAVMTRGSVVARPRWLNGEQAAAVVIPDVDAFLSRPSVDAGEDALRLWMGAAGWADRVVLQTAEPAHPAVQALVRWDPEGFWRGEAERRAALDYPPARHLLLIQPHESGDAPTLAGALRAVLPEDDELLGPDLSGGLMVKTADVHVTLAAVRPLRESWSRASTAVRLDVDPVAY